jgi:Rrf2 family iron-sulfur cluster assembly transcriptional regulator
MKLSTKGRYAVSAMIEIALNAEHGPVTLSDLAANQSISLSYAEQLFAALRKNRLVKGTRGPGGGFTLTRDPADITIAEIIGAVYEDDHSTSPQLADAERHLPTLMWLRLDDRIDEFLSGITLAETMAQGTVVGNVRVPSKATAA